jgi:hypothetical protein
MAMATSYGSMANPPITSRTPFLSKQVHCHRQTICFICLLFIFLAFLILFLGFLKASNWIPATISNGNGTGGMFTVASRKSRNGFQFCAVTGDPGSRNVSDVNFPSDYTELLTQVIGGELEILENR